MQTLQPAQTPHQGVPDPAWFRQGLHDVAAAEAGDHGAMGFGLAAILSGLNTQTEAKPSLTPANPLVVCIKDLDLQERGGPYGPGLVQFGLDPAALVLVRVRRESELQWAAETAAAGPGVAGVLLIAAAEPSLDVFTAGRRLALRAEEAGRAVVQVRPGPLQEAVPAATRWRICSAPSRAPGTLLGSARWQADLIRRRGGQPQSFDLEWDHETHRLCASAELANSTPEPRSEQGFSQGQPSGGGRVAVRNAA
jgi:protein ImuA